MQFRSLSLLIVLCTLANAIAQSIDNIAVIKIAAHRQTSATATTPAWAEFGAFAEGNVTATFPASPRRVTIPGGESYDLDFEGDEWEYSDPLLLTLAELNRDYPDGSYSIQLGAITIPLSFTGGAYPNVPIATPSVGTWVDGELQITESQAAAGFSIRSTANTGSGFSSFDLWSDMTDYELWADSDGSALNVPIPPGALKLHNVYTVAIEFDNVVDSKPATQVSPGANAFAIYSSATEFNIVVVPDSVTPQPQPSTLSVQVTRNSRGVISLSVNWSSAVAASYQLERSTDLVTWIPVGAPAAMTAGQNSRQISFDDGARQFYRLASPGSTNAPGGVLAGARLELSYTIGREILTFAPAGTTFASDVSPGVGGTYTATENQSQISLDVRYDTTAAFANDFQTLTLTKSSPTTGTFSGNSHYEAQDHPVSGTWKILAP